MSLQISEHQLKCPQGMSEEAGEIRFPNILYNFEFL